MGICGQKYKNEEYLEKRIIETKRKITKINTDIKNLDNEVIALNQIINGNNGGQNGRTDDGTKVGKMSIKKKNEENKQLYKKIKKLDKFKSIKYKLESNLEKMEDLRMHKEYNRQFKANNNLFKNNKINGKDIKKNNDLEKEFNDASEEVYRQYKEAEEMSDDGMNQYEIEQKIKEHFKSE